MSPAALPGADADADSDVEALLASPYKGLMPYTEEDAAFFFGREAETELIIANLIASRLTLLYGPSGVGKSSVLRAGVIRQLRDASDAELAERGSRDFVVASFATWRDDPVAGLAACVRDCLLEALGDDVPGASAPAALHELFERARQQDLELLLVLDQFEEYFLYHDQDEGERTFAGEFSRALTRPDLRVNFLVAIREDALAKLDRFEGRIPNLFDNYLRLEHLDREAARIAIEAPIQRYNEISARASRRVSIEPKLVETLLDQVTTGKVIIGQAGRGIVEEPEERGTHDRIETPYLQLVMTRLWTETIRVGSDVLRLETLDELGGAQRIVRTHLDKAMQELPEREQDIAARVFHHLVTPSGTKIAHTASDLSQYEDVPEADLKRVLEKLSSSEVRILRPVASSADAPDAHRYEIYHDVLAAAILDWRNRYVAATEQAETERELAARLAEETRKKQQADEQAVRERRRARTARATALALALLLIATAFFAFQSVRSSQAARSRELVAQALAQLGVDPDQSIRLSLDALRQSRSQQAEEALRRSLAQPHVRSVLRGHTEAVNSVAFSPDARLLVTTGDDNTARVWEVSTGRQVTVLQGHAKRVVKASFSPDPSGSVIVTGSEDSTARLWDSRTGKQLAFIGDEPDTVFPVFARDGGLLLTWSWHGTARLWDWRTHRQLAAFGDGRIEGASISADGRYIVASTSDHRLHLWDRASGAELRSSSQDDSTLNSPVFSADGEMVVAVDDKGRVLTWSWRAERPLREVISYLSHTLSDARFSPDGRQLLIVADKHAELYDASSEEQLGYLGDHRASVLAASFSSDGTAVVTASSDGTARVWEPRPGSEFLGIVTAELRGHSSAVVDAAFSPNGQRVATASSDGTARIWQVTNARVLRGDYGQMLDAEFSRDGRSIVTAGSDGTARVWDATTLKPVSVLGPMDNEVGDASFSPDGKLIATTERFGAAPRIWDVASGDETVTLKPTASSLGPAAAFSPDGKLVVAGDQDGSVRIWDVRSGREVRMLPDVDKGGVASVRFSPDGRLVVTGGGDRVGRILEVATGRVVHALRGHTGVIHGARFSSDGGLVLTASADRTVRIWDATDGRELRVLTGAQSSLTDAAFGPDGTLVIAGGADPTTLVWEWASGRTLAFLHEHGDAINSAAFSPDGKQILTASDDTTAKLYPCATCGPLDEIIRLGEERERATQRR
jgi:WD40 repeat protein